MKVTSLLKLYILLLLYEGPKHGYDLIKSLEEKLGHKPSSSHIYPFLKKLENAGFVELEEVGERDKKIYKLTQSGKKWVEGLLSRMSDLITIAIEPHLSVCASCGCKIFEGGYREEVNGVMLAFCCEHCAEAFKRTME